MYRRRNGCSVAEEGVGQGDLLVHHHVNHADNPSRMQQSQLGGPSPERIRYGQVRVVLRSDDVEERMVQDCVDSVVGELLLDPRRPVVAVDLEFLHFPLVELGCVVAVADGYAVLCLHEVRHNFGVEGVMSPRLLQSVVGAVRDVLANLAPNPREVNAGVPDPSFVGA